MSAALPGSGDPGGAIDEPRGPWHVARAGTMRNTFPAQPGQGMTASGIRIDGAVYALEGMPKPPQSHGWGNLSWLQSVFYRATHPHEISG